MTRSLKNMAVCCRVEVYRNSVTAGAEQVNCFRVVKFIASEGYPRYIPQYFRLCLPLVGGGGWSKAVACYFNLPAAIQCGMDMPSISVRLRTHAWRLQVSLFSCRVLWIIRIWANDLEVAWILRLLNPDLDDPPIFWIPCRTWTLNNSVSSCRHEKEFFGVTMGVHPPHNLSCLLPCRRGQPKTSQPFSRHLCKLAILHFSFYETPA